MIKYVTLLMVIALLMACTAAPVKKPATAPTWMMPPGATLLDSVPMTDGTVMNLYKIKDRCYLATTAGPTLVSLTKTWCPDK